MTKVIKIGVVDSSNVAVYYSDLLAGGEERVFIPSTELEEKVRKSIQRIAAFLNADTATIIKSFGRTHFVEFHRGKDDVSAQIVFEEMFGDADAREKYREIANEIGQKYEGDVRVNPLTTFTPTITLRGAYDNEQERASFEFFAKIMELYEAKLKEAPAGAISGAVIEYEEEDEDEEDYD